MTFGHKYSIIPKNGQISKEIKMNDQVLTLRELARYLKVDEKTIYRLVQEGKIPSFKVRGQWRFKKGFIDNWIEEEVKRNEKPRG